LKPCATVVKRVSGKRLRGEKPNRQRMTIFLYCNADGSEKLRATVINNAAYPVAFKAAKINSRR